MTPVGLQTHFGTLIDHEALVQVRAFGFQWARIDAQTCDVPAMHDMIVQAIDTGFRPLTIVYDEERLAAVPAAAVDVEWSNEPDGDILPATFRAQLDRACEIALARGLRLWAPAISNLDRDSLLWLELVRAAGWPAGLYGISAHRYGDGTFEYAHPPAATRADEVVRLRSLCDGRPYIITEFGYPTYPVSAVQDRPRRMRYLQPDLHLSESQQAERIAQEWQFWHEQGCTAPFLYQINDGTQPDEGYGIRRCLPDGTLNGWKPSAYTVPLEDPPMAEIANVLDNTVFAKSDLVAVPGRDGDYGLRFPTGAETLLSPKTTNVHELRDMSYLGALDETCRIAGKLVYFPNVSGQRFAWPLVDD